MRGILLFIFFYVSCYFCNGQGDGNFRKYLDEDFAFTTQKKASYGALATKSGDHWYLLAVYPDTSTLIKAYFKDKSLKIKDGPFVFYYQKNIKAFEGYYVNNVQQGVWKYYHRNGQLKDSGLIKNNQMVDVWKTWNENGNLLAIANYLSPDSIADDFIFQPTTKDGKTGLLNSDTTINLPHGRWISYYDNGQQAESGNYRYGFKEGEWISWHKNGSIESKGAYHTAEQQGDWEYYYENGKTSTREKYKDNKVVAMECYDENGNSIGSFCSIKKPATPELDRFVSFESYMLDNIFWPADLKGLNVNGVVRASFTITKEGKLKDVTILEAPHELLAEEVKRFLLSIKKWSPAISHNRIIEFNGTLEVPFYR